MSLGDALQLLPGIRQNSPNIDPDTRREAIEAISTPVIGLTEPLQNVGNIPNFKSSPNMIQQGRKVFKGLEDLSTRLLEKFRGMPEEITPQQFNEVINRASKEGIKKVDLDLVKDSIKEIDGKINLTDLSKRVQTQFVPLTPTQVKNPRWSNVGEDFIGDGKYGEIVYESPIKTSAGNVHFSSSPASYPSDGKLGAKAQEYPNYFSHIRYEDLADGTTRKMLETQSDLFQKENFAREQGLTEGQYTRLKKTADLLGDVNEPMTKRYEEVQKLQPYNSNDPLAHLRTFREEVKRASQDGKDTLLIPSGETAMKIEGLGERSQFSIVEYNPSGRIKSFMPLNVDALKVGKEFEQGQINTGNKWIITDILGDGKFKAVPKEKIFEKNEIISDFNKDRIIRIPDGSGYLEEVVETFDISGKVDTKHFVYKLNEEAIPREARKMGLEVEGKVKVDNGEWWKVKIPKESAKEPVSAFGQSPIGAILGTAGATLGLTAAEREVSRHFKSYKYDRNKEEDKQQQSKGRIPFSGLVDTIAHQESEIFQDPKTKEWYTPTMQQRYEYHKPSGKPELGEDLGKYQITTADLKTYSKRYLGTQISPKTFLASPDLQDRYVRNEVKDRESQGATDEEIFASHRYGRNGDYSQPTPQSYIKDAMEYYNKTLKEKYKQ